VTAPFVPRRCGKKEGIFDLPALAPAIHTSEKFRKKMAGQRALLGWYYSSACESVLSLTLILRSRRSLRLEGCAARPSPFETPTSLAPQGEGLCSGKSFENGPHAIFCPVSRLNRTKMFHVKHFGTIGGRNDHTLARRENSLLDEIFCLVREGGTVALTQRV
jgi:hypothetical protein